MYLYIECGSTPHASPVLIFLKHTQVSRLSEGLMVCPMIIDQSSNHYNLIESKLK